LNPESLIVLEHCKAEPEVRRTSPGDYLQFIRNGYFCPDSKDHSPEHPVFNRTVTLKDSWAKMKQKMGL
jgi:glutaminyl-tRNA synthetase